MLRQFQRLHWSGSSPVAHLAPVLVSITRKAPVCAFRQALMVLPWGIDATATLPPNRNIPSKIALTRHDQRTLRGFPAIRFPPDCCLWQVAERCPETICAKRDFRKKSSAPDALSEMGAQPGGSRSADAIDDARSWVVPWPVTAVRNGSRSTAR